MFIYLVRMNNPDYYTSLYETVVVHNSEEEAKSWLEEDEEDKASVIGITCIGTYTGERDHPHGILNNASNQ